MKCLVTGATGFVGSHLVRLLLEQGWTVVCLVRPSSSRKNIENLPVIVFPGDLRDPDSLKEAVDDCTVVFHCAADYRLWCPDPGEMLASNVEGTDHLLRACWDKRVDRVVYTSTVGCLGLDPEGGVADETTPVNPRQLVGPYKQSKYQAEQKALQWAEKSLPVVIVNPSTPVGERDIKPTPTGKIIVDFLRGRMFGFVDTGMNLVDVRDVAKGHLLAAESGRVGEKYILGNANLTLKEIFDMLAEITGMASPKLRVPHAIALAYAGLENFWAIRLRGREPEVPLDAVRMARHKMWFDASKAVRELGMPQGPVREALKRAVTWFREKGYAP